MRHRNGIFGFVAAVLLLVGMAATPARALPEFSRMYNVPCRTCHTVAPHLNATGQAFQANFFRWTSADGAVLTKQKGLIAVPMSGIVTTDTVRNSSLGITSRFQYETLELYATDSFALDPRRNGGYFIKGVAAIREGRAGDLDDAWVALPVAGANGQFAVTAGQFTPMEFQYDPINSLTTSLPVALSQGTDGVAFTAPTPGVRLDYFDNRGKGTANGNYLALGLSAKDRLTLNNTAHVNGPRGVFVHGFRRQDKYSMGAFGYENGGHRQWGFLGTGDVLPDVHLLLAAATSRDIFGNTVLNSRGLSFEANWIATPMVALTGRLESMSGFQKETYPVAGITYYPFHPEVLRLSAETVQQKGNRQISLTAYLQF